MPPRPCAGSTRRGTETAPRSRGGLPRRLRSLMSWATPMKTDRIAGRVGAIRVTRASIQTARAILAVISAHSPRKSFPPAIARVSLRGQERPVPFRHPLSHRSAQHLLGPPAEEPGGTIVPVCTMPSRSVTMTDPSRLSPAASGVDAAQRFLGEPPLRDILCQGYDPGIFSIGILRPVTYCTTHRR